MTVRVGGTGRAGARRRARRLSLLVGVPTLGVNLVLSAVPASAVAPIVPAAPNPYEQVFCDPAAGACTTSPLTGSTDTFTATATGGNRSATLVAVLNNSTSPDCPQFEEGNSDWVHVGFSDAQRGSTWNKVVVMTSTEPATLTAARAALRRDLVCFEAPYRFFVRPGYKLDEGKRERGPYAGVLATCTTVDSLFPTEFRSRVQPLPCILGRRVVASGAGWVVQNIVRIPRDTAATKLRHNVQPPS